MARICKHPKSLAWESYRNSRTNWNGKMKCNSCGKIWFNPMVKYYFDRKNGVRCAVDHELDKLIGIT